MSGRSMPMAAPALASLLTDRDPRRIEAALAKDSLDAGDAAALQGELARRHNDPRAASLLDEALQRRTDVPALFHASALAHVAAGDRSAARRAWQALLKLAPDDAIARFQIGLTCEDDGELHEATRWYEMQVAHAPSSFAAWLNLGRAQSALGDAKRALASWDRAHRLRPDDVRPLLLAAALAGANADLPGAIALASKAIDVAPSSAHARFLRAAHRSSLGDHRDAVQDLRAAIALDPTNVAGHSALLLELHYDETLASHEAMRSEHEAWGARHAQAPRIAEPGAHERRRLRIGYLSPRFGDAPLAALLLPVLEAHDRSRYEIVAYAAHAAQGEAAQRVRANVDHWRDLPRSDDDAAALIAADSLDLLVDLCGHAPGNRLPVLSRRPAPCQATWLDYFDTTGVAAIDYLIGDAVHTPTRHATRFTERLVQLPHARFAYRPPAAFARTPRRVASRAITFGSFNRHAKIGDPVIDAWAAILLQVPGSRLALRAAAYRSASTVEAIRARWRARGVPVERITFDPFVSLAELDAAYADVDVALDSFPFNGGVTTCDALAHGVPVVALEGERMISRQGSALLRAAGRARWIAATRDEYVALAVALASRETLERERASLLADFPRSPLCDVVSFTRTLERAFETMIAAPAGPREPLSIEPVDAGVAMPR